MDQTDYSPMRAETRKPLIVAVDDGYARMKLCVPRRQSRIDMPWVGHPVIREFGTVISSRPDVMTDADGSVTGRWEADGQQFTVSEMIKGDNSATDDFHWSRMNRVLVNHYLSECGLSGMEIDLLVVGLPMSQFFTSGGKRSEYVDRKIDNLLRPVTPIGKTKAPPRIKSVSVKPQGMSALVDDVMDWDLNVLSGFPDRVAIIDIGGRTTDLAYIIQGKQTQSSNSGSLQIGVLDVLSQLNNEIKASFDRQADLPAGILDRALRQKTYMHKGTECDVRDLVAKSIKTLAETIKSEIRARMGDADIANKIILVGGGATVFESAMKEEYPGAYAPPDPSWANVRGFWKSGALETQRA